MSFGNPPGGASAYQYSSAIAPTVSFNRRLSYTNSFNLDSNTVSSLIVNILHEDRC